MSFNGGGVTVEGSQQGATMVPLCCGCLEVQRMNVGCMRCSSSPVEAGPLPSGWGYDWASGSGRPGSQGTGGAARPLVLRNSRVLAALDADGDELPPVIVPLRFL